MADKIQPFSARWSPLIWLITILFGLIVLIIIPHSILHIVRAGALANEQTRAWLFLVWVIPLIILLTTVLFAPMKYTVTNTEIIVNRFGPNVIIPIEHIDDIRRIQKQELGFALRIFGSGGFCGGYGTFYNGRLGLFQAYITNRKSLVFIKCSGRKKFLISPETPEEFLCIVADAQIHLSSSK